MAAVVALINRLISEFTTLGVPLATFGGVLIALSMVSVPFIPAWFQSYRGAIFKVGGGLLLLGLIPMIISVISTLK